MVAMFWVALTLVAAADQPRVDRIRILDYGEYRDRLLTTEPVPGAAMGHWRIVTDAELLQRTDTVCASLGLTFGFEYVLEGNPPGTTVEVEMVTRFPAPGLVNETGERFLLNTRKRMLEIGARSYRSYMFEAAWEMAPGIWSFEFHHAGRKIGEQRFTVLRSCPIS